MYFILSKVLLFILNLLLWVFALLLIAVLAKNPRYKRKSLIIGIVVLYLFSIPLLLNLFVRFWDISKSELPDGRVYSSAIVLGGFTSTDNKGSGYFNSASDRFIQGVLLQKTGRVKHILISSGNGNLFADGFKEADWAKKRLIEMQVPDSAILIENQSRNTIENASFSKSILQKHHLKGPYLLVTSAFHMRRALMIFKKRGIDVIAYPCNFNGISNGVSFDDLLPNAGALAGWGVYLKEAIGYVTNYFSK